MKKGWAIASIAIMVSVWSGAASAGPIQDITNWLADQIRSVWDAFVAFMHDFGVFLVETVLDLVNVIIHAIPSPEFLQQLSLCAILSNAGPWASWAISTFRIGEALALLAAALVFRLLRVFLTLFQWT